MLKYHKLEERKRVTLYYINRLIIMVVMHVINKTIKNLVKIIPEIKVLENII